jgi:Flp pilus assembly protein TadG
MKWIMAQWRKLAGETSGSEIAEVAVVLPLLMVILLAIVLFGRAFNIYTTVTHAAREGARLGLTSSCATCLNVASTAAQIDTQVMQSLQASNINTGGIRQYAPSPLPTNGACPGAMGTSTANNINVYTNAQLSKAGDPLACGVVVSFKYPYTFSLFDPVQFATRTYSLPLIAEVHMQGEN